jgi:hypothetical protein
MSSSFDVVVTPQPPVLAHSKVPSLAVARMAHGATSEDEGGYMEELRRSARLGGDDAYKVDRIGKGVRIRKGPRSTGPLAAATSLLTSCQSTSIRCSASMLILYRR